MRKAFSTRPFNSVFATETRFLEEMHSWWSESCYSRVHWLENHFGCLKRTFTEHSLKVFSREDFTRPTPFFQLSLSIVIFFCTSRSQDEMESRSGKKHWRYFWNVVKTRFKRKKVSNLFTFYFTECKISDWQEVCCGSCYVKLKAFVFKSCYTRNWYLYSWIQGLTSWETSVSVKGAM